MKKQRFLIAGGAGFIGSHLVEELLLRESEVCILDNFTSGSYQNISHLTISDSLSIYNLDIIEELPLLTDFDYVIHLASIANTSDYEKNPINALRVNAEGNLNLLEVAKNSNAKYIFFSSSEVYGHHKLSNGRDLSEETTFNLKTNGIRSPYFVGKLYGEELVANFCNINSLEYIVIRPFNIYGPRMDVKSKYGRVIPNFIKWAKKKKPLKIHGDGNQERSFCFVSDLIDCFLKIINYDQFSYNFVNIGNPEPINILKLAKLINKITNNPNGCIHVDRYPHEPDYRTPNIDRVKTWLNWFPKVSLEEGLKIMCSFNESIDREVIINENFSYSTNI